MLLRSFAVASFAACLALACSSSTTPGSDAGTDGGGKTPADCEAIAEACHRVDPGSGPLHECHEDAEKENVTAAECAKRKAECVPLCQAGAKDAGAGDAGPGADAGEHEHEHEDGGEHGGDAAHDH